MTADPLSRPTAAEAKLPPDALPSPLDALGDMRSAARWIIGAAAAVGALLLGGGPLAAFNRINDWGDAIHTGAGLLVALGGVCLAIWSTSDALIPPITTLESLEDDRLRTLRTLIHQRPNAFFGPFGQTVVDLQKATSFHSRVMTNATRNAAKETDPTRRLVYELTASDARDNLDHCIYRVRRLLAFIHAWQVRNALRRARWNIVVALVVCTIGVIVFLTATIDDGPASATQPNPSSSTTR